MPGISAQTGTRRLAALGAAATLVLSAAVVVASRGSDPSTEDTVLRNVVNATARTVQGRPLPVTDGTVLPAGARLDTGSTGAAELVTAGRTVYVGALSTVTVVDGVAERLGRGQVMVDARSGPRLALDTEAGTVSVTGGTLARVERGPLLRLGVFTGRASVTAADRQATSTVPRLFQVQVPYGGLPQRTTPLALTEGDRWERLLARDLVSADQDLNRLATGLAGAAGLVVLAAAPVAYRSEVATTSTVPSGEQALRLAVAQAAAGAGRTPQERISAVQGDRVAGGSWGVVAALVQARVSAVSLLLDGVLARSVTAPVSAAAAAGALPLDVLLGDPLAPAAGAPGAAAAGAVPGGADGSGPGLVPRPEPSPTPGVTGPVPSPLPTAPTTPGAPSPDPVLASIVNTVLGLVSPSPTPTPTPTAPVPAALPSPSPSSTPLVGVLLPTLIH